MDWKVICMWTVLLRILGTQQPFQSQSIYIFKIAHTKLFPITTVLFVPRLSLSMAVPAAVPGPIPATITEPEPTADPAELEKRATDCYVGLGAWPYREGPDVSYTQLDTLWGPEIGSLNCHWG
jgi:hypothetical protein